MASRGFWKKFWIIIYCAAIIGLALWLTAPKASAQQGNPPMHQYLTTEQIAACSEWLSDWLNGQDQIKWEEEWHEKLCEPIGTLTCEDVKKIQERYCKEPKELKYKVHK